MLTTPLMPSYVAMDFCSKKPADPHMLPAKPDSRLQFPSMYIRNNILSFHPDTVTLMNATVRSSAFDNPDYRRFSGYGSSSTRMAKLDFKASMLPATIWPLSFNS
ncbi:hypothetical protein E1B28_007978 [Marasmius oreades]|uniref:Uncharacterized protein n=1 Tax=Marasmius oreades TaxID=181124 RepID=A0A9P7S2Z7_9AGAR|nr:uncharacterized protein E1B28_007978 [Marasmius oreades]KAG7094377.1 hypothetical protein E1B28_007978 [Marasmius oreades]